MSDRDFLREDALLYAAQFANHGKYKKCVDGTIGGLIEYLSQFPPSWQLSIRGADEKGEWCCREEHVLQMSSIAAVLMSIGKEIEH